MHDHDADVCAPWFAERRRAVPAVRRGCRVDVVLFEPTGGLDISLRRIQRRRLDLHRYGQHALLRRQRIGGRRLRFCRRERLRRSIDVLQANLPFSFLANLSDEAAGRRLQHCRHFARRLSTQAPSRRARRRSFATASCRASNAACCRRRAAHTRPMGGEHGACRHGPGYDGEPGAGDRRADRLFAAAARALAEHRSQLLQGGRARRAVGRGDRGLAGLRRCLGARPL